MAGKVVYPIGVKLNIIITLLLIFSLGAEITLIAFFGYTDMEHTASVNNHSINTMSASMAALELNVIRSSARSFLEAAEKIDTNRGEALASLTRFFFNEEKEIALILLPDSEGGISAAAGYANASFLAQNEIDQSALAAFLETNPVAVSRARTGESVLLNAAPVCGGVQILTLIFPKQSANSLATAGRLYEPAAVFFSAQNLIDSFAAGANGSFLTNDTGDALVHYDQDLTSKGVNLMSESFIRDCWNSGQQAVQSPFKDSAGVKFFGDFARIEGFPAAGVFTTIQHTVVFEGIQTANRRNIALSVMVAFLSILFIWFFSKIFSRPLVELTGAVHQVDAGNYHIKIEKQNKDETGILVRSVVSMSHAIGNFERFTNKTVVRLSREGALKAEGTNKTATLFFSDIRSFTAISEKMTAREVVRFLNAYMEQMVACVNATGGIVDKFIGDAVMAHWGAVETAGSPAQDALNGVCCALMMRVCLYNFNAARSGDDKEPKIRIGCGLNTGPVLAGQIGSAERIVYTVIGQSVSFADRTETFNKPFGGEILISENTWNFVKDFFITEEMPSVTEAEKRVRIFAVVNLQDKAETARVLGLLDAMPSNNPSLTRKCLGPEGPQTLAELRTLLGIPTPDLTNLNLDEEEKKYSIVQTPQHT